MRWGMPHLLEPSSQRNINAVSARLERQDIVQNLLAVTRRLLLGQLATPTVGNTGFRNAVVGYGVVFQNVLRAHNTADHKLAQLPVNAHFLAGHHHKVTVRQHLRNGAGQCKRDRFCPADGAGAGVSTCAARVQRIGLGQVRQGLALEPEQAGNTKIFRPAGRGGRVIRDIRIIRNLDLDGQQVPT